MTTRLNGVKMTNLIINILPVREISRDDLFSHFHHLFADGFFRCQKWMNSLKNRIKLQVGYSPKHLISTIWDFAFVQEMKLTSKSLGNPIKNWRFCVVALKLRAITKRLASFLHSPADIETAFGVYISSKIRKIVFCRYLSIFYRIQLIFYVPLDKVGFFLVRIHDFYDRVFKNLSVDRSKFLEKEIFVSFFYKKFSNVWKTFKTFFGKSKMVGNRSIAGSGLNGSNGAVESISEPHNWFFSYRNNHEVASPFLITNLKTSVSVYIASCVSKISGIHEHIMSKLVHLSQQVIVTDK